jgi:hypothetical protein
MKRAKRTKGRGAKRKKHVLANGTVVRSGFEKRVLSKIRDGEFWRYEAVRVPYLATRYYWPDVEIAPLEDYDAARYVELKGRFTSADRTKTLLVLKHNPDIDLRFLFQANNTLTKTSKTRYSDWCDKHNIPWAVGERIPDEWFR